MTAERASRLVGAGAKGTPLTPEDFLSVLTGVEARYPVSEWRVDGVHAWPIVRTRAMRFNDEAKALAKGRETAPSEKSRHANAARRVLAGARSAARAGREDREHHVPRRPGSADLLFFGDAVSRVAMGGVWYDRFCDPIADAAASLGMRSVQLEPHHHYPTPRARPSRYVQPRLDLIDAATRLAPGRASESLEGWDGLTAELHEAGISAAALDRAATVREVVLINWQARSLARFFDSVRPRLAILVDYTIPAMAFTLAARRAGVPSVEIQHSIPPVDHPMYAAWAATPPGGYEPLPTRYWTWTEGAAAVIRSWATAVPDGPRTVVGGSPWLESWRSPSHGLMRGYDERFAAERASRPGQTQVLLTFQRTMGTSDVIGPILEAATATRDRAHWWYRLHPTTRPEEAARVRAAVAASGVGPQSRDVTADPLYAVLRHTDVHVTHMSSTVHEAALFGVRSVLTDPDASAGYPDLFEAGWAIQASTAPDIVSAVLTPGPGQTANPATPQRAGPDPTDTLATLLAGDQSRGDAIRD